MATHEHTYLTCNLCDKLLTDGSSDHNIVYGEDRKCVRNKAYDMGWRCSRDYANDTNNVIDICESCLAKN